MTRRTAALLLLGTLALAALHWLLPVAIVRDLARSDPDTARLLLVELRLPRTLLALGTGAVLGLTGAALQALFANPLASPDITGSSSGAALGAVAGAYWLGAAHPLAIAAFGAGGAIAALAFLLMIAGRRAEPATLLLAGLAIALAAGAGTSLLLALAPSPFAFYDGFQWLMGSFVDRSLDQAAAALLPASAAALILLRQSRALDLMALGNDTVAAMGLDPRRTGILVIAASAVAVGACVSVCGAIAFVGLIAPFLGRSLARGHPGRAMVPSAALGAIVLLAADLLVRFGPPGRELPVGVITTIIGTPVFILLLLRLRRKMAA